MSRRLTLFINDEYFLFYQTFVLSCWFQLETLFCLWACRVAVLFGKVDKWNIFSRTIMLCVVAKPVSSCYLGGLWLNLAHPPPAIFEPRLAQFLSELMSESSSCSEDARARYGWSHLQISVAEVCFNEEHSRWGIWRGGREMGGSLKGIKLQTPPVYKEQT